MAETVLDGKNTWLSRWSTDIPVFDLNIITQNQAFSHLVAYV